MAESEKLLYRRSNKAPFERRAYAFLIDFVLVWLISSLVTNLLLEFVIFLILWLVSRVVVVDKNKGQSLGRWAMDLKIVDLKSNRLPSLIALTKRESIFAVACFLAMIGLKINFLDLLLMLFCLAPLVADGIAILSDDENNQSFHDRLSGTIITQTPRGFSLDLRIKKLIAQLREKWRQNRTNNQ